MRYVRYAHGTYAWARRIVPTAVTVALWHCRCPHAVGAAQALRLMGKRSVALTYFGEGCASEGDIPSALNIAAVHKTPTIFFCRNNGYAISTQVHEAAAGASGWVREGLQGLHALYGWVAPPAYGCDV